MEDRTGDLVKAFNKSNMRDFYRQFTTPDSQAAALKTLAKAERIARKADDHLKAALVRNAPKQGPVLAPGGATSRANESQRLANVQTATRQHQRRAKAVTRAMNKQLQRVALKQQRSQGQTQDQKQGQRQATTIRPAFNRAAGRSLKDEFNRKR